MRKDVLMKMLDLMHIDNNTPEGIQKILKLISLPSFMDTCYDFEEETHLDKKMNVYLILATYSFENKDYERCFKALKEPIKLEYVRAILLANDAIEKIFEDSSEDIFSYLTEEEWEDIYNKYNRYNQLKVKSFLTNRKLKDLEEQDKAILNISDRVGYDFKEILNFRKRYSNQEDSYRYAIQIYQKGRKNLGIFFLHLAAIQGHPTAKYMIGYLYEQSGNIMEAMKWYKDVVELKNSMIGKSQMAYIGSALLSRKRALSLFKEAAEEYCTDLADIQYIK